MSTASGSCGATKGAKMEMATMSSRITTATRPQRKRSSRRQAAPRTACGSARSPPRSASSIGRGTLIAASRRADAGVDEPHQEIDDEVHGHDEQGQQHYRALDHRKVLIAD